MKSILPLLLLFLGTASASQTRKDASEVFQQAFYLEQGTGDLKAAIELYEELVSEFPDAREYAARALYRLGLCYALAGEDKAVDRLTRLIEDYPDQRQLVERAKEELRKLGGSKDHRDDVSSTFRLRELKRLDGTAVWDPHAALSPDGRYLVYWDGENGRGLILLDLKQETVTRVAPGQIDPAFESWRYRWSPGSDAVCLDLNDSKGNALAIYSMQQNELRILVRLDRARLVPVHWSRDGKVIVCLSRADGDPDRILLVDSSTGEIHTEVEVPEQVDPFTYRLRPDNRYLAYSSWGDNPEVSIVLLESGTPIVVAPHPAKDQDPLWSPDGRFLAFLSDRLKSTDLWAVSISADGTISVPFLVTKDLGPDARLISWWKMDQLVVAREARLRDIWALPMENGGPMAAGPAFIVTKTQGQNVQPAVSPNGQWVAFNSTGADGKPRLGISAVEGNEEYFFDDLPPTIYNPTWRDDHTVLLVGGDSKGGAFLECDINERKQVRVVDFPLGEEFTQTPNWIRHPPRPDFSRDGLLLFDIIQPETARSGLYVFDGSRSERVPGTDRAGFGRWTPDGHHVITAELVNGRVSLIRLNLADGERESLISLGQSESIQTFALDPTGRFLAFPHFVKGESRYEFWNLELLSLETGELSTFDLPRGLNPWWVDWSHDGRYIVFGSLRILNGLYILENFWPDDLSHLREPR